jgi:cyclopropane fatty-acyl-phospholipid synthase-like methyltransferase
MGGKEKYFFEKQYTSSDINKLIINYYNATQFFYNIMWMTQSSLAMHYGIWDNNIKKLNDAQINENKIISNYLQLNSSDIVMDAGCGICGTSIWMAENCHCKAIGLTLCEKQAEQASKIIKKRNLERQVSVEIKDFCKTDYKDEFFSKIFGIESICYAPDQKAFAIEAYRLLQPGGCFVRADGFLSKKDLTPYEKKVLSEWCEGWAVPGLETIEDYEKKLRDVGFTNIKSIVITDKIIKSAKAMWWINMPFYLPFKLLYILKLLSRDNFMDVLASLNQRELFINGITSYVIVTADKPKH